MLENPENGLNEWWLKLVKRRSRPHIALLAAVLWSMINDFLFCFVEQI